MHEQLRLDLAIFVGVDMHSGFTPLHSCCRMTEAVTHYGESIKAIMNEELGDGIMSAIDMYATVSSIICLFSHLACSMYLTYPQKG